MVCHLVAHDPRVGRGPKDRHLVALGHQADVDLNGCLCLVLAWSDCVKCWWCEGGKQQTRHHLFTECRAWLAQIRRLWKDIGGVHGWKHPRAPSGKFAILFEGRLPEVLRPILERKNAIIQVMKGYEPSGKWPWKEKSTEEMLVFLGSTRVGCISAKRSPPEEVDGVGLDDEEEEGGPGPSEM